MSFPETSKSIFWCVGHIGFEPVECEMNDRPIFLVGFMGCGKTSLGRLLAAEMHWDFIDLDEELIKRDGRHIKDIFEQNGEEFFRGVETAALRDIARRKRTVIALGGGT